MATSVVPLTLNSPLQSNWLTPLAIGTQRVYPPQPIVAGYWIVVVDRVSLAVVYNQIQTAYDTAPNLGPYNTDGYMLIVAAIAMTLNLVPQGPFYDFLNANGAATQLARIEQINDQIGCGSVGVFSYILVSVLGQSQSGVPGLEASSVDYANNFGAILTASLIGTVINGQTVYSPFLLE